MTIHSEHPFVESEPNRDPLRRFRGRVGGTVSLWTTGSRETGRHGLTVSSYLVAAGEPGHLLALLDPESDFAEAVVHTGVAMVQLLSWDDRNLADAFAGQFPAPGGVWRMADWVASEWGPRLSTAANWAGVRLSGDGRRVGWSLLVDGLVERVEVGDDALPLIHRRGRYQRPQV